MKKGILAIVCFVIAFSLMFSIVSPIQEILQLENGILADYEDVETLNKTGRLGSFIKAQMEEHQNIVGGAKVKQNQVVFKLFGFLPIKKVSVEIDDDLYYVGGVPIGLSINTDGAIVVSGEDGLFKEGDIITKINGEKIDGLEQIQDLLKEKNEEAEVEFMRKNKKLKSIVKTKRGEDGKLRLGLWVKDDIAGIGTLTFVNKKTNRYAALGHAIVESNGGSIIPVSDGKIYDCDLIGITKGKKNNPGELKCVFMPTSKFKGTIESNTKFGINGVMVDGSDLVDENLTAKLGGRLGVKMGKAKIVSSISGIREEYDIEIIKANYQKNASDKSLVFRVKDKRLLEMTGGIVQGMSGSPIVQDGKIIGAVTHVFLNDPTKGYGVYSDWMKNK